MEQFNNLIEFRQAIYSNGFSKARDVQFELVDALLVGAPIRSYPELSLLPVFRRKWPSIYTAVEDGEQNWEWLENYFIQQLLEPLFIGDGIPVGRENPDPEQNLAHSATA